MQHLLTRPLVVLVHRADVVLVGRARLNAARAIATDRVQARASERDLAALESLRPAAVGRPA